MLPPAPPKPPFRQHVQSLRTLCLTLVLIYHLTPSRLPAGYLGVDLFFTISSFVITRQSIPPLPSPIPSAFYIRRYWRLYPASVTTVFFTLIFAILLYPPPMARLVAEAGLATLFGAANILYYSRVNYFDTSSLFNPLLHTWSLSLEEQYYLIYPLLHRYIVRLPIPALPGLTAATALSLAVGTHLHHTHPTFAFFLLPARIPHFLVGAIAAVLESRLPDRKPSPVQRAVIDLMSLLSLFTVALYALFLPPNASPIQLFPLLLSAVVLLLSHHSYVARVLSHPIPVLIGRMSYAIYLVHWPVIVYLRFLLEGLLLSAPPVLVLATITFVLANIVHHAIEEPLRHGKNNQKRIAFISMLVVTVCMALSGIKSDGWRGRYEDGMGGAVDWSDHVKRINDLCLYEDGSSPASKYEAKGCRIGALDGARPPVVLIGDSFAQSAVRGLDALGKERNESYAVWYTCSCPFVPSVNESIKHRKVSCVDVHRRRWKVVKSMEGNMTFIIMNAWGWVDLKDMEGRLTGMTAELRESGHSMVVVEEPPGLGLVERKRFSCQDLAQQPLLVGWSRVTGWKRRKCTSAWMQPTGTRRRNSILYNRVYKSMLNRKQFVSIFDKVCEIRRDSAYCSIFTEPDENGEYSSLGYERDRIHLNWEGSLFMRNILRESFEKRIIPFAHSRWQNIAEDSSDRHTTTVARL